MTIYMYDVGFAERLHRSIPVPMEIFSKEAERTPS